MDSSAIKAARAMWDAARPLEAGRILFEAMPEDDRPSWAGAVLRFCCAYTPTVPAEVKAVLDLTGTRSAWHRGHLVFDALRRLTLRIEGNEMPADTMLRGIVGVAENVAKVTYNATFPDDPFDADSGWWIASNVYWIQQRIADEAFDDRAWSVLSGQSLGE
jgi:hypothetical protein